MNPLTYRLRLYILISVYFFRAELLVSYFLKERQISCLRNLLVVWY